MKRFFCDGTFWRGMLQIAFPIALQNLLMSSFVLVDTVMVSQLGDQPLAAVGMAGQWSFLLNLFLFGFSSGASLFISQYWGIKDTENIRKVYGMTLANTLIAGLIFTVSASLLPHLILRLYSSDPNIIDLGASYLRIAAFSYIGVVFNLVFSTVLRATEQVKLPMFISFFSTFLNAGLNYCFIFGLGPIPAMGVRGAALATCISAWAAPILLLVVSIRKKNILYCSIRTLLSFTRKELLGYYRRALPVVCNETLWALGITMLNMIYGHLGHENYAAVTIQRSVGDIGFAFFVGVCNACCVMVGKAVGSGNLKRARTDATRFAVLVPIMGIVIGLIVIPLRMPLIQFFNMSGLLTPYTLQTTMSILLIYALELCLRNIPYIMIVGIFRSGGDTLIGMFLDLGCLWLCSLPLAYCAAFVWKWPFVWVFLLVFLAEDVPKSILSLWRFVSKKWIKPVTEEGRKALENERTEEGVK